MGQSAQTLWLRVLLKAWGYEHSGGSMIDHIYLPVTDLKRSETFYGAMLGPLGKSESWHFKDLTGFGEPGIPGFWLKASKTTCAELYVAFAAKNEAAVNNAYDAALANGGKD